MDYRLKENRREAFMRWYAWALEYKDCDPAVWLTNYLNKRYEHNDEERIWLCWLYGNTYQLPTTWVLKNEFPDYELATIDRITNWNTTNYKRLRYQTDTKWNKGHLPVMFASYQKLIGNRSQREVMESYYDGTSETNFTSIWNLFQSNLHKFGRYSCWFYLQHLYHTAGIDVIPTSLMLSDYSGSRSHRNGLLFALGQDDRMDERLSSAEYNSLESAATDILIEMKIRFPNIRNQINFFTMETCLCSFKKLFRTKHGRYLGYYLDRQSEEIAQAEQDGWCGIDWNVLWQARNETLNQRLSYRQRIKEEKFTFFLNSGKIDQLDWMFDDTSESGLEGFFV